MSDSFAHGRSLDSSAPTDSSVARNTVERNAQLLGFLQKNHLLETSQALAASMGSAALGAALAQRAASTQSSMDVMTAEHLAAAMPELGHSLQESAGRGGSSLAPSSSMALSGRPPAFPQVGVQMSDHQQLESFACQSVHSVDNVVLKQHQLSKYLQVCVSFVVIVIARGTRHTFYDLWSECCPPFVQSVLNADDLMLQGQRPGRLASVTEEEEALPNKDAIRHWLQYGRPPGTKGVLDQQVLPSTVFELLVKS